MIADKSEMVRTSIIIPAFNEAENLTRILPPVLAQVGPMDEVIVVDNGSLDGTANVASTWGVLVVKESVRGRSRARNKGIESSRGKVLVFLDADCHPSPDWLHNLLMPFDKSEVGCVAGEIRILNSGTRLGRYLNSKGHLSQQVNFAHPFLPYAGSGNVAFRREILEQIGGFDEELYSGHDADICWRMQLETNYQIVLSSDAVVDHHQTLTFPALVRQKRRHAYGAVLLYKKYKDRRNLENRCFKTVYWEYRSIFKRALRFLVNPAAVRFGVARALPSEQGYQLLMEISEKVGRIEGSIQQRVWYP